VTIEARLRVATSGGDALADLDEVCDCGNALGVLQ
jgi:hypothetical protein